MSGLPSRHLLIFYMYTSLSFSTKTTHTSIPASLHKTVSSLHFRSLLSLSKTLLPLNLSCILPKTRFLYFSTGPLQIFTSPSILLQSQFFIGPRFTSSSFLIQTRPNFVTRKVLLVRGRWILFFIWPLLPMYLIVGSPTTVHNLGNSFPHRSVRKGIPCGA